MVSLNVETNTCNKNVAVSIVIQIVRKANFLVPNYFTARISVKERNRRNAIKIEKNRK